MAAPKIQGKNQFGEPIIFSLLQTPTSLQTLSTAMPAKADVTALVALAGGSTLAQTITQLNALLAALKTVV